MNSQFTQKKGGKKLVWLLLFLLLMLAGNSFAQTLSIQKVSVSGCYYSGGTSKATVSVEVGWTGLVAGNNITVTLGAQTKTILAESTPAFSKIVSPQVVAFEVPSNGASGTVSATVLALSANGAYAAPSPCAPLQCSAGELGGQAFFDYNNDGTHQSTETQGQAGITVNVTDKNGVVHTTTTDNMGKWKLNIPSGDYCVRVEYSNIPSNLRNSSTIAGATTTQFYNSATCSADLGLLNIADYSQSNPKVYVPIWANGDPANSANSTKYAISTFNYTQTGNPLGGGQISNSGVIPYSYAGSLWGMAWDRTNKKVYSSAILRRHTGLGVAGLAGIYQYDPVANTYTSFDLAATTGENFGTVQTNTARNLGGPPTPSWDIDAYAKVGKVGIGAISVNEEGTLMYVMNLFQKQIVVVNLPSMTLNKVINVPDPGCTGGTYRPWSCSYYKGDLYVGVVCDAQSSNNKSNLTATIYQIDPVTNASTQILEFPLTYPKGYPNGNVTSGWLPWSDNYMDMVNSNNATGAGNNGGYPTPVLADIDFDIDGAMVIALDDRSAWQYGYYNYLPDPTFTNTNLWAANAGGDILRAYYSNGVYALENGGKAGALTGANPTNNEGPGFGEFFNDNFTCCHTETMSGGIAIKPGSGEVAAVMMDPNNTTSQIFAGGVKYMNNNNGAYARAYNIYGGSNNLNTFGKSNGLGDVVFAVDNPNFSQIGNRVWQDTDGDGIQDPCEAGIAGITMKLYDAMGALVGTTTTNSTGNYYFGNGVNGINLTPGATYYVTAGEGQYSATNGLVAGMNKYGELTLTNTGEGTNPTNNDNNGSIAPNAGVTAGFAGIPYAQVTAPATNTVDHTIDFGFTYGSIGNYVWKDDNRDGLQNEPASNGINGVTVELYKETTPGNFTLVGTTVTANDGGGNPGYYNFIVPTSGNYQVKFPTTVSGNSLTTQTATAATDGNSDANATTGNSPVVVMNVTGTGVAKNNPTIDAGYIVPLGSLGNYVWYDDNNDGLQNEPASNGVNGVKVYLYKESAPGSGSYLIFDSTITANDGGGNPGFYNFDSLSSANYKVKFPTNIGNYPLSTPNNQAAQVDGNNDANSTGFSGVVPINVYGAGFNKDNPTIDAGYRRNIGSLGNYVWFDQNGDGLQNEPASNGLNGVKVYLLDGLGNKLDSTVTANNGGNPGYYNFPNLMSGTYQVQFPTTNGGYPLSSTINQTPQVDGNTDANTTTGKSGLVTINTNSSNPLDVNNPTIDAGYGKLGTLGNYVWYDANKNGLQDEPNTNGINGIKVILWKETAPSVYTKVDSLITTNDSLGRPGWYTFYNLNTGNYKVQFPTSWGNNFLTPTNNQAPQVDGNNDADGTGFSGIIPINPGLGGLHRDNPTVDAGYYCDCNGFTATIGMNKTTDCFAGNSFSFTANTNRSGGSFRYFWDFGDGTTSTLANPTHSYAAAGEYDVKLIVSDSTHCNCRYEASVHQIYVGPKPTINFDWQYNGNCLTYDFNSNSTVSMGWITNRFWDFGNGQTSTQNNPLATFATAGTYNVKLVITTNYGCKDSLIFPVNIINKCTTSGNSTGSTNGGGGVSPAPCSAGWWSQPATNNCDSTLRFNVSNTTAGATYTWNFGDGNTGTGNPVTHKYAAPGNYLVKLVVEKPTPSACKDSVSYNVYISNCSVTSGGGGGIESKSLGTIISQRLYGNAINNRSQDLGRTNQPLPVSNAIQLNGPSDLRLVDLTPVSVVGTNKAFISSPTDLVNFTNAVEVLSVDYTNNNVTKAVAFGTRTLGDVYSHTKPICDRLRGAELLEVKTININGYTVMAYMVKQRTGEIEYAMNLNAGVRKTRNTISLQSNWFTNSYVPDETMFNFQLWAVSYDMVSNMARDIVSKLQQQGVVNSVTTTDLPLAYVQKGARVNTNVNFTIQNNTAQTTGYFELKEKQNEGSAERVRQIPFTIAANKTSQVQLPVQDYYEASIYMYLNNKLVDLVYMADGSWNVDYNKNNTSIQQFTVSNEVNPVINNNEYRLFRNVSVTSTTKDYISLYKTTNGGGLEQNLSMYNSLKFNATTTGVGNLKITIIKKGIVNWNNQFSFTTNLNEKGEYSINLADFKDGAGRGGLQATDVLGVNIALQNTRGGTTNMTATVSGLRFSKEGSIANSAAVAKLVSVYPNPSKGLFTANFTSEADEALVMRVIEMASGKTVKTQFVQAKKGANQVAIELSGVVANGMYNVVVEGDNSKYQVQKLYIQRY